MGGKAFIGQRHLQLQAAGGGGGGGGGGAEACTGETDVGVGGTTVTTGLETSTAATLGTSDWMMVSEKES
jgi:hypothetical protein